MKRKFNVNLEIEVEYNSDQAIYTHLGYSITDGGKVQLIAFTGYLTNGNQKQLPISNVKLNEFKALANED